MSQMRLWCGDGWAVRVIRSAEVTAVACQFGPRSACRSRVRCSPEVTAVAGLRSIGADERQALAEAGDSRPRGGRCGQN